MIGVHIVVRVGVHIVRCAELDQIDIVVMVGVHIVRCAELDQILLLCHVTEHTTVLRDVTPLSLTYVPVFRKMYCHCLWW